MNADLFMERMQLDAQGAMFGAFVSGLFCELAFASSDTKLMLTGAFALAAGAATDRFLTTPLLKERAKNEPVIRNN